MLIPTQVAPAFVGICGTDIHEYLGGPTFAPTEPHPVTGETIPIGFGHEFSGVVAEVGENITDLKAGQNVVVQPTVCCWKCGACEVGAENACDKGGFIGLSGGGGGMSDFVVVPRYAVMNLPPNVPLEVGALVEPLAVGWHAVSASPIEPGDRCLVMGGGPIGLAVIQALKARKAGLIITAEISGQRQKFATKFGADHIINPAKEDVVKKSREYCSGFNGKPDTGPDLVFDCAGVPASLTAACTAVRSRGTVVNVAIWEKEVPFNPNMLVFREGRYVAVLGYQKPDFEYVVSALASGAIQPAAMITKKIKLQDLVQEGMYCSCSFLQHQTDSCHQGIMTLVTDKDNHVKILIDLHAG